MAEKNEDMIQNHDTYKALFDENTPSDEIRKIYDGWAETYDHINITNWDYGPEDASVRSVFIEYFGSNKDVKILDIGAGTGRVAQLLQELGFTNIDALDASSQMLELAKKDNLYKSYICEFLGPKKLDIEDGYYDVLFGLSSLLPSHINEESFDEMIRLTKPGGYIMHIVRDGAIGPGRIKIETYMQKFHDEGKWEWKVKEVISPLRICYNGSIVNGYKYIFKVPQNTCEAYHNDLN